MVNLPFNLSITFGLNYLEIPDSWVFIKFLLLIDISFISTSFLLSIKPPLFRL